MSKATDLLVFKEFVQAIQSNTGLTRENANALALELQQCAVDHMAASGIACGSLKCMLPEGLQDAIERKVEQTLSDIEGVGIGKWNHDPRGDFSLRLVFKDGTENCWVGGFGVPLGSNKVQLQMSEQNWSAYKHLLPLHIKGDCDIADLSEDDRKRLTSVERGLYVTHTHNLSLPRLQTCGHLVAERSANLNLPVLQVVSNGVYAACSKNLSMPALQKTGSENFVVEGAKNLTIPFDLAMDKGVPLECLSEATLERGIQQLSEVKNARTLPPKGIR